MRGLDEEGGSIENLIPKLSSQFNQLGITMLDTDGQIRSTFDILKDLSGVWDGLTTNQKTYLAELMAGKK